MARVYILGGGFAGLAAARRLRRSEGLSVHLIDQREESVFAPLLPDLVSGRIRPENVVASIPDYCNDAGIAFHKEQVREIIPGGESRVITNSGEHKTDFVIVALGSVTNYFGMKEVEERSIGLKSVEEATDIRDRICALIKDAQSGKPGTVVVVGGGYTGFETASHAAFLIHTLTKLPYTRIREVCRVAVVEKAEQVMGNVSDSIREWVQKMIQSYGVDLFTGVTANPPDNDRVITLSDGTRFENAIMIWTTGVKPVPAIDSFKPEKTHGRIAVEETLRVKGQECIFAAGDNAGPVRPGETMPLRLSIQFSLRGGEYAARNVLHTIRNEKLEQFNPADPGYILPLAPKRAAGIILGHEFHGRMPSLAHYFMCVFRTWRWRKRFGIIRDLL